MFDLIEGTAGLPGDLSETNPHQYGAGDVIALDARFAALAALDPGQLFGLTMQLLEVPAQATRVLCGLRRILSKVFRRQLSYTQKYVENSHNGHD